MDIQSRLDQNLRLVAQGRHFTKQRSLGTRRVRCPDCRLSFETTVIDGGGISNVLYCPDCKAQFAISLEPWFQRLIGTAWFWLRVWLIRAGIIP